MDFKRTLIFAAIITLIDIPNQDGAISKENLESKLNKLNLNIKRSQSIESAIKSLSKNKNTITEKNKPTSILRVLLFSFFVLNIINDAKIVINVK